MLRRKTLVGITKVRLMSYSLPIKSFEESRVHNNMYACIIREYAKICKTKCRIHWQTRDSGVTDVGMNTSMDT